MANLDKVLLLLTLVLILRVASLLFQRTKDANWDKSFGFDNLGKQYDGSVSKPDVTVTYNLNGVKINYGLTVKIMKCKMLIMALINILLMLS